MEKVIGFLSMVAEEVRGLQGATAGVTLVIAVLNCFLGYRLLKAWIALAGFYRTSVDYLLGLTEDPRPYRQRSRQP